MGLTLAFDSNSLFMSCSRVKVNLVNKIMKRYSVNSSSIDYVCEFIYSVGYVYMASIVWSIVVI